MDKPDNGFLSKVSPDRRSFVQTLLGLTGYGIPAVRSFLMGTAVALPALSYPVTTTAPPTTSPRPTTTTPRATTTHPSWRPRPNNAG